MIHAMLLFSQCSKYLNTNICVNAQLFIYVCKYVAEKVPLSQLHALSKNMEIKLGQITTLHVYFDLKGYLGP